jgi:hypothetical protein
MRVPFLLGKTAVRPAASRYTYRRNALFAHHPLFAQLEAECRRNVELMWLLGRLCPDHNSIAEFRRMHREAVTVAGAQLVRFAQSCGLIQGEWVAIDGSKFRAVSSSDSVRGRQALERYLDSCEQADREQEQQAEIDSSAVQSALKKLRQHPEPEVGFMPVAGAKAPA